MPQMDRPVQTKWYSDGRLAQIGPQQEKQIDRNRRRPRGRNLLLKMQLLKNLQQLLHQDLTIAGEKTTQQPGG